MARRTSARRRLEQLAGEFEPTLQRAFLAAVADLVSNVQLGRVVERLERGDIEGALSALNVEPAAFRQFEEAIRQAYIGGGVAATSGMPLLRGPEGNRLVIRFDARSPRAEAFLREMSVTRVSGQITDDLITGMRSFLTSGMVDGRNPRSVALDLVGRVDRASGRRTGGVIGLTSRQMEYVATAKGDLLSGDPARLRHYLTLGRRDKRFDKAVKAAIRDGKTLDAATIDRMTGRLSDSYLLLRGETIARTEAIGALNASQREAYEQAIASGAVNRQDVRKVWRATRDNRTRDSHRSLDGESASMDERFANGLLYPCEPGAPAEEVIACRCSCDYRIDFMANLT